MRWLVETSRPFWGVDADLSFVPKSAPLPPKSWLIGVFDNSDQAGALGYHDLTQAGLPLAKVFAGTDMQYNSAWTVTASHELLDMLDRGAQLTHVAGPVIAKQRVHRIRRLATENDQSKMPRSRDFPVGGAELFKKWLDTRAAP